MARTPRPAPDPEADALADLSYEEARDELVAIVARLEGGQADLAESMRLWERGERLAEHCGRWLDGAQARLTAGDDGDPAGDEPQPEADAGDEPADTPDDPDAD